MTPPIEIPIGDPKFKANPYPVYARLRAEAPVAQVRLRRGEAAYLLSRYDDVASLLKDARFAKDPANAPTDAKVRRNPPKFLAPLTRNMLAMDDPDHARLRRLVQATFTPRRVSQLEARTKAISTHLVGQLERRRRFDLITDYAMPLPVTVISELLGVPAADQTKFARWAGALLHAPAARFSMVLALPQIFAFLRYLRKLIALKRADPADDLVSALVEAEAGGESLSGEELMAMIGILVSAGHETTMNLIGNGMATLLAHPDQAEALRNDPDLIETAVEELLRFSSPVEMSTHRYARHDVEIAGTVIPAGALVFGLIASANRDETRFPEADRLDLSRKPNRHLTFGEGGHYCLGASLARMEGKVALLDLLTRLPKLALGVKLDRLHWRPGIVLRGLKTLPLIVQEGYGLPPSRTQG